MSRSPMVGPDGLAKTIAGVALVGEPGSPCCCGASGDFEVIRLVDCCNPARVRWVALVPDDPASTSWATRACRRGNSRCVNPPRDHPVLVKQVGDGGRVLACWLSDPASIVPFAALAPELQALVYPPIGSAGTDMPSIAEAGCGDPECPTCTSCCRAVVQDVDHVCGPEHCCECGETSRLTVTAMHELTIDVRPVWLDAGVEVVWPVALRVYRYTASGQAAVEAACGVPTWFTGHWSWTKSSAPLAYTIGCNNFETVALAPPVVTNGEGPWVLHAGLDGCGVSPNAEAGYIGLLPLGFIDDNWRCLVGDQSSFVSTGDGCRGSWTKRSTVPTGEWRYCTTTWGMTVDCQGGTSTKEFLSDIGLIWEAYCMADSCTGSCNGQQSDVGVRATITATVTVAWSGVALQPCIEHPCAGPAAVTQRAVPRHESAARELLRAIALGAS